MNNETRAQGATGAGLVSGSDREATQGPGHAPPQTARKRDWGMFSLGAIPGLVVGVLIGVGLAAGASDESPAGIETALEDCSLTAETSGVYVLDDGQALELDGSGEGVLSGGLDTDDQVCVLDGLGMPESGYSRMSSTRALDGTQTISWDDFRASWTYHPDDGLDIIVEPADG